jgi:DNA-binding beta-propeller fold protein YncE
MHILTLLLLAGCADNTLMSRSPGADASEYAGDDDDRADGDDDAAPGANDEADGEAPDENEQDTFTTRPRSTDVFVFIANPSRDTVSKINAATRTIETIDVGDEPVQVVVSGDYQRAVAFNRGDDSVSIIDVNTNNVAELRVREDMNWIEMSPDGRWVLAWFNAQAPDADWYTDGVRSYTEVSFVDTMNLQVQSFSVGFNPKGVRFTADSSEAVVYSDGFLTVADLDAEPIALSLVDLGEDPVTPDVARTLEVLPDGAWAYVLYPQADKLKAVDMLSKEVHHLDAGLGPQDIDLTPDDRLAVVARDSHEVRLFDALHPLAIPEIVATPEDYHMGQLLLTPGGDQGLLFTNSYAENQITVWDLATGAMEVHGLVKPVDNVSISPDGRSALVLHALWDAEDGDPLFAGRHALTVVDLQSWLMNPVQLAAQPKDWTTSEDGRYSLFIMEGNRNVGVVDYATRLVDDLIVPSQPVFLGIMPGADSVEETLGWVSQEHELGRISFVHPWEGAVETVTGFELNSDID